MTNVCTCVTIPKVRLQTISSTRNVSWGPFMVTVFTDHVVLGSACSIVSSKGHMNEIVQWVASFAFRITFLGFSPVVALGSRFLFLLALLRCSDIAQYTCPLSHLRTFGCFQTTQVVGDREHSYSKHLGTDLCVNMCFHFLRNGVSRSHGEKLLNCFP